MTKNTISKETIINIANENTTNEQELALSLKYPFCVFEVAATFYDFVSDENLNGIKDYEHSKPLKDIINELNEQGYFYCIINNIEKDYNELLNEIGSEDATDYINELIRYNERPTISNIINLYIYKNVIKLIIDNQ